jgi:ubiquinone/menaquinone biosynthesis C-methylase UbiE
MPSQPQESQAAKLSSPPKPLQNYFTSNEVAARYAQVRPFFHDEVVERLLGFSSGARFHRALDVGCGSGQSSIAVAAIAERVIGMDASQQMLDHAPQHPNVSYQLGVAERLDFTAGEFDLVTVGSALHWFDQDRFFAECRRVMAPAGVLLVYNDHFTAHMQDVPACRRWMRTRFAKRVPPLRGMRDIHEFKAIAGGFEIAQRSSFTHLAPFSRDEFVAYLLTCSNALAAIHSGSESYQSIVDWLDNELAGIIPDGVTGSFIFKCNLWIMRRAMVL